MNTIKKLELMTCSLGLGNNSALSTAYCLKAALERGPLRYKGSLFLIKKFVDCQHLIQ